MAKDHLLAGDQGTSSSRAIVFHRDGHIVAKPQRELTQHYPQPGGVEHDADEIWAGQFAVAQQALAAASLVAQDIAAIDSWLFWNLTGQPNGGHGHATDVSNAARTMLFDIRHNAWDPALLAAMDVPDSLLPAVHPSGHAFGQTTLFGADIPICGLAPCPMPVA